MSSPETPCDICESCSECKESVVVSSIENTPTTTENIDVKIGAMSLMESYSAQPIVKFSSSQDFSSTDIGNAGYDVRSDEKTIIPAGKRQVVKTDLKLETPNYMFPRILPRSGLALKGIDTKGGVVDSNYRRFIGIILKNDSDEDFNIEVGDRIAQIVFIPVYHPTLIKVNPEDLSDTKRGTNGFGSSGMK